MKNLTYFFSFLLITLISNRAYTQPFEAFIDVDFSQEALKEVQVGPSPLKTQVLFIGGYDEVQTLDSGGNPNGTAVAKQWHDFIGFTPDNESDDLGWVSVNHEMVLHDPKIGDGGGMTVFKIKKDNETDTLIIVEQTLPDGRTGKFFNVDFVNTVGETGMNCGGIVSPDGRIWTAEEWFRYGNGDIFENGTGVLDTNDFTISSDIEGFDGLTVKKYQNFNWMVEIDPKEAKAVRKQYNWGRQPFEGGAILPDMKTVFTGADDTPGFLTKFVANKKGDFTKGKTYVFKQIEKKGKTKAKGKWIKLDNTNPDVMLNFNEKAVEVGATMFNRLEWVTCNEKTGMVYLTETGRDNPGSRWADEYADGATIASHHYKRAKKQGTEPTASDYVDYYGRVLVLNPKKNTVKVHLEGGPSFDEVDVPLESYPSTHLSNPDGISTLYIGNKQFLLIQEDLNGRNHGRVPSDAYYNSTCELYALDLDIVNPEINDLLRIAVVPAGAEVTGARALPDGNTILFDIQHPSTSNPFPFNNSLTMAVTGWHEVAAWYGIEAYPEKSGEVENSENLISAEKANNFTIYPNPAFRTLRFNKITDVAIYDQSGRRIMISRNSDSVDISNLQPGIYFVKTMEGEIQKLVVQ